MNQKSKWVRVDLDLEHFVCLTDKCGELVNNFHNINSNLETNLLPPFVHVIHFLLGKFDSFVACVASYLPTFPSLISQLLTEAQFCLCQQRAHEYTFTATSRKHSIQC